ncbi:CPBP family glutamic-type intramembrane protease [Cellulomonas sp. P5_C5]
MTAVLTATSSPSTSAEPNRTPDFPFYNGLPSRISGAGWATIVAAVAAGGAVDMFLPVGGPAWFSTLVRGLLFVAIPLAAFVLVARPDWRVIFRGVGRRDVKLWFGFAALNVVITSVVGVALSQVMDMQANPMVGALADLSGGERVATFLSMVPQLFGEELFTILVLLATLTLLSRVVRLPRRVAVVGAVLVATLVFAAIHLPTYGGNFLQCLAVIGVARVVLLIPFLTTKNIWASTGAHVLNDWTLFAIGLATAAAVV